MMPFLRLFTEAEKSISDQENSNYGEIRKLNFSSESTHQFEKIDFWIKLIWSPLLKISASFNVEYFLKWTIFKVALEIIN